MFNKLSLDGVGGHLIFNSVYKPIHNFFKKSKISENAIYLDPENKIWVTLILR